MSVQNKTQGGRNETQESQPPLNTSSSAPLEERARLRRRLEGHGSQITIAPNTNARCKTDNKLATRNENGAVQGGCGPSKAVSDAHAVVNQQDKGTEGRDVERSTRSFRVDQVTPEDDINLALGSVSTDVQLVQLLQHLENSQLKTHVQLAAVRNKLRGKGSGGEPLLQLEGGSDGPRVKNSLPPKGYSLEVMSGAYRESKANESYIKKRWNLDVDLTSHYSSATWTKPTPPPAPLDRRSEDGELVRNSEKRLERLSRREKERKRRSPSRSRSRSRSRKKSRRHSPRGRRRSRTRSKSRSPVRHRKHHSPGSDGSGQKRSRGRSRSRSFSRSKPKGRDAREPDALEAKSIVKGPTFRGGGSLRGSGSLLRSSEQTKVPEGSGVAKAKQPTQTPPAAAKPKAAAQVAAKVALQVAEPASKALQQQKTIDPQPKTASLAPPAPKTQPPVRAPTVNMVTILQPMNRSMPPTAVPPAPPAPSPSVATVQVPAPPKPMTTPVLHATPVPPPPSNPPGKPVPTSTRPSDQTSHAAVLVQKLTSLGGLRPPLPQPSSQAGDSVPPNQAPPVFRQFPVDVVPRPPLQTLRPVAPPQVVSSSPIHFSSGMVRPGFGQGPHALIQRPPVPARPNGFTQPGPISPWPNHSQTLGSGMEQLNVYSGGVSQWPPGIHPQQPQASLNTGEAPRLAGSGMPLAPAPAVHHAPAAQVQTQQQSRRRGGNAIVYQSQRPPALRPVGGVPMILATPALATPALATPALATPALATPALATPALATPALSTAPVPSVAIQAANGARSGVVNGTNPVGVPAPLPVSTPLAVTGSNPQVPAGKGRKDNRWGPAGQKPGEENDPEVQKTDKKATQGEQGTTVSDSDDDGLAFVQPSPVPPPVKAPTLKVFKGPPPLLIRSKQLAHDPLTMCVAMRLVSSRVTEFRKALWKILPSKPEVPKTEAKLSKLVATVEKSDESMLNLRHLRENQKLFRLLGGDVATTSTKHWNKIDCLWRLCPYATAQGVCKNPQCLFQHQANTKMTASEKNQELSQLLSQQAQRGGSTQTSFSWPLSANVVKKIEKQRGLDSTRVLPGGDAISQNVVNNLELLKGWGQTRVFKSSLLSASTYLSDEVLESCKLYRDLAGFTPPGVIVATSGFYDKSSGLLRDSSMEEAIASVWEAVGSNSLSGARSLVFRERVLVHLQTCFNSAYDGESRRDLKLWLGMLPLWSRQGKIPHGERSIMMERAAKEHSSCYQMLLWLAAEEANPKKKIAIFKQGISVLNRAAKIKDYGLSREECVQRLGPCIVDLALKVLHLSMCTQEGIMEGAISAVSTYANVQPVEDLLEMVSDDWMLVTLQVSHRFPVEATAVWLSLVHCVLFNKMPDEIVHRFGYPQATITIKWDLTDVSLERLRVAREIFLYASSSKLGGLDLNTRASTSSQMAAKECIAFNIMRFDMAMNYSSRQGSPLLCEIFPNEESTAEGTDKWKSMLSESSWKASCCLSAQGDASDSEVDDMEVDKDWKEDKGAKSLVAQGMMVHYEVVREKGISRFWRRQVASMWTDFEENDDGMGPFRNLHLQQSLWLRHAMTALEQDDDGPTEAYLVLTNGAASLMPISGDNVPDKLRLLKEKSRHKSSQPTGTNEVVSAEKAFLCYKILLEPELRQLYLESRSGLEDGEMMDPSCMNWTTDELAAGWINCAITQLLGGAMENVYPCMRKALNVCSGNQDLRMQWWSEILTCISSVLGPVERGCKDSVDEDSHHAKGRWSGWQSSHAGSNSTEHELCMPSCDSKAKLDVSRSMMDERAKTFRVFKSLVLEFFEEVTLQGEVEGLELPKVRWSDSNMQDIASPSSCVDLMPAVGLFRPQLKSLTQGEIVSMVESLVERYPTSPAMALLVLDAGSLLPGHNLAWCWIPTLVTVLLSAKPPVSPDLWVQSIQVIEAYSKSSGRELAEQALMVHPYAEAVRKLNEN
ncbi:hypothetical protein BSKO_01690 [Bryopsis sp. KO-2023]|nr:hypothetical protein BSKO_01690 [Bryopsis sp. KO-2023]